MKGGEEDVGGNLGYQGKVRKTPSRKATALLSIGSSLQIGMSQPSAEFLCEIFSFEQLFVCEHSFFASSTSFSVHSHSGKNTSPETNTVSTETCACCGWCPSAAKDEISVWQEQGYVPLDFKRRPHSAL